MSDRMLSEEEEADLLQRALDKGWLSRSELPDGRASASSTPARLGVRLDALVEAGVLSEEAISALLREAASASTLQPASAALGLAPTLPPPASDGLAGNAIPPVPPAEHAFVSPVPGWERYELLSLLGRGGMGTVYKARDLRLHRFVAVKFLHAEHESAVRRFQQEARAQARIDHENVCKVYEVGVASGKPYIAMELVNGVPLHAVVDQLRLEEKLCIMRDTAEALHAAHRLGIVHRDVKPSNILVQRRDDGTWRSVLMDFGLAQDAAVEQHLTRSGVVMGTPVYMSPEQARGETRNLDRRTDVYALGATLFELLTGRTPFEGENQTEVLLKVLSDEPLPLRAVQPGLPADLETIVMKCLNREPAQRYASARALAEDLQRYLNGEPIAGKPASLLYRLRRRAQKHQAAVVVGCLALIGLSLVGAYGVQARLQVRRERVQAEARAKLSQELGQDVKEMEWFMRAVHELPVHDTSYAQKILQARIQKLKSIGHGLGSAGDGLVQYALGNAYVALQDFDRAYEHLSDAQHKGNDTPALRAALGRVLGEQYKTKIEEALRIGDVSFVRAQKKELRAKYIQPAVALLRSSQGAELGSPLLLAGLIALYSEQYDEALSQAEAVAKQSPWLYEAKQLAGDVYFARGIDLRSETKFDEAKQSFERAVGKYKEAAESGRSDVILYEAIAESYLQWGDIATNLQSRFAEVTLHEQANASCEKALLIAPDRPSCYSKSARAYALIINANMLQDRPFGAYFEKIKLIARKGLVLNPDDYDLYDSLGLAHMSAALEASADGEEDVPKMMKNLDISIGYIQRSLKIFPNSPRAHTNLAVLYLNKSLNVVSHAIPGERPEYELAISHQKAACVIDPNYAPARDGLFNTYGYLIQYLTESGRDPSATYRELKKESDAFLAMNRGDDLPIWSIAVGYHQYARYVLLAGNYADLPDVVERQKALSAYAERVLSPGHGVAALVRLHRAEDEARLLVFQGQDPSAVLAMGRAAVAGCDALWFALKSYCHRIASSLALLSADQAALRGQPVLPHIQQAVADARQAVTLLAREVDSHEQLARALLRLAEAQTPSSIAITEGLKICTALLRSNAGWTEGHALRGRFYLLKMKAAGTAKERLAWARQAHDDLALAVQRNPLLARPYQRYIAQANELLTKLSSN